MQTNDEHSLITSLSPDIPLPTNNECKLRFYSPYLLSINQWWSKRKSKNVKQNKWRTDSIPKIVKSNKQGKPTNNKNWRRSFGIKNVKYLNEGDNNGNELFIGQNNTEKKKKKHRYALDTESGIDTCPLAQFKRHNYPYLWHNPKTKH